MREASRCLRCDIRETVAHAVPPVGATSRAAADLGPHRQRAMHRHAKARPSSRWPRTNGRSIPTLCYLEGLSSPGSCRLCLVEVAGVGRLLPACTTPAQSGMSVTTNSENLAHNRLMALELLFVERNHVCSVCVSNGHCELQSMAQTLGLTHVHMPYNFPRLPVDVSHPRFVLDHNRCILCSRCVRVCDEIEGAHVWDISARGINSMLVAELESAMGRSAVLHQLRQVRAGVPDRRAGGKGPGGRGNDQAQRHRHRSRRQAGARHEEAEAGHDVARRLLRLPYVAARHRRRHADDRREGRVGLQPAGRRSRISRTTSMSPSSKARSAATRISRRYGMVRERTRILVALGDCAITTNVTGHAQSDPAESIWIASMSKARMCRKVHPTKDLPVAEAVDPAADVVKVDLHVPGCPPSAPTILFVLEELLAGDPGSGPKRISAEETDADHRHRSGHPHRGSLQDHDPSR